MRFSKVHAGTHGLRSGIMALWHSSQNNNCLSPPQWCKQRSTYSPTCKGYFEQGANCWREAVSEASISPFAKGCRQHSSFIIAFIFIILLLLMPHHTIAACC